MVDIMNIFLAIMITYLIRIPKGMGLGLRRQFVFREICVSQVQ